MRYSRQTLMDVILRGVRATLETGDNQLRVLKRSFGGVALLVVGDPLQGSPIVDGDGCLDCEWIWVIEFCKDYVPLLHLYLCVWVCDSLYVERNTCVACGNCISIIIKHVCLVAMETCEIEYMRWSVVECHSFKSMWKW